MTAARKRPPRCECGGILRRRILRKYDFTAFAGIESPVVLMDVPGLKCSKCSGEALEGEVVESALDTVGRMIAQMSCRLTGTLARYLRRELVLTQQELADRLSVARVVVAKWEAGDTAIPTAHAEALRTEVFLKTCGRPCLFGTTVMITTGSGPIQERIDRPIMKLPPRSSTTPKTTQRRRRRAQPKKEK
jgi:DNA-binding transcriptional regulator YiaG